MGVKILKLMKNVTAYGDVRQGEYESLAELMLLQ